MANELETAFYRLRQALLHYLRGRISDASQAEDLLQDVFVKALVSQRAGHRIRNPAAWLYTAARTTAIDHYRANGKIAQPLHENLPPEEVEDLQLHAEISGCLKIFIRQLPAIYRDTLVAVDLDGERMHSLAQRAKVSVSAIKSRAARGRVMLREKLLRCCHVEMTGGLVRDYRPLSSSCCR